MVFKKSSSEQQPVILSVKDLSKTYVSFKKDAGFWGGVKAFVKRRRLDVVAVQDLDFEIRRGEFVGLLGPNGAGKTTTLKMLTGLISATRGKAVAFNEYDTSTRPKSYLRRIGMVMGQRNQLNPDLPAADSFRLAQAIYGITEEKYQRRLHECLDLFAIHDKLLIPVRKLSLGERMKMELILAILHEPELLFLDEPTIGLDFNAARQIRDFLAEANARLGITVILTSHYTKDIEELCRRVILINHGRTVFDGALTDMDARIKGQKTTTLTFADPQSCEKALACLKQHHISVDAADAKTEGAPSPGHPTLTFDAPPEQISTILSTLSKATDAKAILDLKIGEKPLDEIFAAIYRQPNAEAVH